MPQVAFASEALAAATFEVGDHVTALWPGDKNTEPGEYQATILELHAPRGSGKRLSATVKYDDGDEGTVALANLSSKTKQTVTAAWPAVQEATIAKFRKVDWATMSLGKSTVVEHMRRGLTGKAPNKPGAKTKLDPCVHDVAASFTKLVQVERFSGGVKARQFRTKFMQSIDGTEHEFREASDSDLESDVGDDAGGAEAGAEEQPLQQAASSSKERTEEAALPAAGALCSHRDNHLMLPSTVICVATPHTKHAVEQY